MYNPFFYFPPICDSCVTKIHNSDWHGEPSSKLWDICQYSASLCWYSPNHPSVWWKQTHIRAFWRKMMGLCSVQSVFTEFETELACQQSCQSRQLNLSDGIYTPHTATQHGDLLERQWSVKKAKEEGHPENGETTHTCTIQQHVVCQCRKFCH